jgi:hypothetical protein
MKICAGGNGKVRNWLFSQVHWFLRFSPSPNGCNKRMLAQVIQEAP